MLPPRKRLQSTQRSVFLGSQVLSWARRIILGVQVPSQTCFGVASGVAEPFDGSQGSVAVAVLAEVKNRPGLLAVLSNSNLPKKTGIEIPKSTGNGTNCLEFRAWCTGNGKRLNSLGKGSQILA